MQNLTDEELDRNVLYWLREHVGKANAVDRWDLVAYVFRTDPVPMELRNDDNIQDREIRYAVGRLRAEGHLICDLGDGNGRWMAANEKEFWEFYGYYVKPIKSRAEVARALKDAAQRRWPNLLQPSLFEAAKVEAG